MGGRRQSAVTGTVALGTRHRTHLIVAYIVIALVNALAIRPTRERFCDVLDIWDSVYKGSDWPTDMTHGNTVQIN